MTKQSAGNADLAAQGSNMNDFAAPISEQIWDMKYRHKSHDGTIYDKTVHDTWARIAGALAEAEGNPKEWYPVFYEALEDFKFLPAGRITAGAGTNRAGVTLFNCFVNGTIPDSLSGIFDMLKDAALTMQQGGGIGYDFSTIRPKGCLVKGVDADASGPLSFMDVWDSMCKTIMSAGGRRGAMMATMRCDHPDIEEFITAKQDAGRLRHFNVSVLVTDPFMHAVKSDDQWHLVWNGEVYKTVRARDLWDLIMKNTYSHAEPGVIFIDRVNDRNPLKYCETIAATNPCGEQALPPYGACLLGSINLVKFIKGGAFDLDEISRIVSVAIRMMDNTIDVSNFPLPQQNQEAIAKRRIGLGVTGLADALAMMGVKYGTGEAEYFTEGIMAHIADSAARASIDLAKEKGSFPLFDADLYYNDTVPHLADEIKEHGIRNALLTSIAPTGTISLYAGNVSSGIEPIFAFEYVRKVTQKDGTKTDETVTDYAIADYRAKSNSGLFPEYFVTAQDIKPLDHVGMQAAAQKYVDNAISKTINCPVDIPFDEFKDVYMKAWEMGCKGCTTYRPNDVTGSVLEVVAHAEGDAGACLYDPETGERSCSG